MAKFHLITDHSDTAWLARRLQDEGHNVTLFTYDPAAKDVARGLVPLTNVVYPPRDSIVIFDSSNHGNLGAAFRARGFPVIGGNPIDADLEIDRTKATKLFRRAGIQTPETHSFTSINQAQAFLATHRGHWYFKPSGNLSTTFTYDGESSDLSRWLTWAGTEGHIAKLRGFELQRRQDGVEVSVEGWFDGRRWVAPFNSTVEVKKLCTGDLGARTGCQSNCVWAWSDSVPRLAQLTVIRMTNLLREHKFVGAFDLNCILDEDGTPFALEASPRIGLDAFQALSMLIEGDLGAQLAAFAKGELRSFSVRQDQLAMTLRLNIYPYPVESALAAKKVKGLPLDPKLLDKPEEAFLDDILVNDEGLPELAGRDGAIGCIGVTGRDAGLMRKQLLKRAKGFRVPGMFYRLDPVPKLEETWGALREMGYLSSRDVPRQGDASPRGDADGPPVSPAARDDGANTPVEDDGKAPFMADVPGDV